MSVLRTQLAGIARRPARLLLAGLAVLVVSFVVFATVLAQRITERAVLDGLSGTPAAVDLVVRGGTATTAELAAVGRLTGVAEAVGRADAGGQIGGDFLQIIGDPGVGPLAVARPVAGRYPAAPDEIAVTPRTAERMGLRVGTTTRAVLRHDANGKPLQATALTVVGLVTARDDYGFQAYAPQPLVTAMSGDDSLRQIDLRLAPGADPLAVREQVAAVLATGAAADRPQVESGAEVRRAEAEQKADEVDTVFLVIGMFLAVAVVAAALVVTSTFRIVFAQRVRQLALLRAVGAGRRAITWSLAAEGALTGLVAGLAGVLLALGAGHLAPVVLRAFGKHVPQPGVPLAAALGVVLLAVAVTVLAVIAPAVSASRVSPLEALRGASTTGARTGIGGLRWATGLLLVAGAALLAGYAGVNLPGRDAKDYSPGPLLFAVVGSGALAFFALIALGPVLVRPMLAALGWPVRRAGALGRLAAGGVGGAPRRAAAVSVVVALGVTLITGVLVGGASVRVLAEREAAMSSPADFEMTPVDGGPIPAAAADRARTRPELAHVAPYRRLEVTVAGTEVNANDLDLSALPALRKLDVAAGSLADRGPGTAVISGFVADATGLGLGDEAELRQGPHRVRVTVTAVLPGTVPLGSGLGLDPGDLSRLGGAAGYTGILADATGDGERGRTDGRRALGDAAAAVGTDGHVTVLADQRDQIDANITLLLVIALGLIGLTVLIAVVGVGTTTALSVVERVREAGLLRAVGLSRGGLRVMLTTEAALYGVLGAGLGLALGVPYACLAVLALGVNAPLILPVAQLAAVFVLLVLLTALAGVLPAGRAAKVSPVVALGTE